MSTKKTEIPVALERKSKKATEIEARMEAGKIEIMKVVEGVAGAEKLGELIERGKKKGSLSSAELMEVLEDMVLESEEMNHLTHIASQPESLANASRSLSDYIAVIRQEALRRQSEDQDALLRAAQQRYKEKKAYMEEKP